MWTFNLISFTWSNLSLVIQYLGTFLCHIFFSLQISYLVLYWNPLLLGQIYLIVFLTLLLYLHIYILQFLFFSDMETYHIFLEQYKFVLRHFFKNIKYRFNSLVFFSSVLSARVYMLPLGMILKIIITALTINIPNHIGIYAHISSLWVLKPSLRA